MQITDVRVKKIFAKGNMKAVASITFDNEFVVHDIKVIEKMNEDNTSYLMIAMPSKKIPGAVDSGEKGRFRDMAHPINSETRKKIENAILEVYNKAEDVNEQPAE